MPERCDVSFTLNGQPRQTRVPLRMHLVDFLRAEYQLASPRMGCEHGIYGACTIRLDGAIVRGCTVLAADLEGRRIETLEHLTDTQEIRDLQEAFFASNAAQCGYCTSGMLMTAAELLKHGQVSSRAAIRDHLSGNICRCTGYEAIIDAIEGTLKARAAQTTAPGTHG